MNRLSDTEHSELLVRLTSGPPKRDLGIQKAVLLVTPEGYVVRLWFLQASLHHMVRAVQMVSGGTAISHSHIGNIVAAEDGMPVVTFGPVDADQLRKL